MKRRGRGTRPAAPTLVTVMALLLTPFHSKGSFGEPIRRSWWYFCEHEKCDVTVDSPHQLLERERPFCRHGHGRLTGEKPPSSEGG